MGKFTVGMLLAVALQGMSKDKEIPLEGGTSFDLVSFDPGSQRLFVAHAPKFDVIDTKAGAKVGEVSGAEGAHMAIAVPDTRLGFGSAGAKNRLLVFDLDTFKVTKEIETGANPDALLYVASQKEVWCFNGRGRNATCVDVATLEVKATIALEGKPELSVEDPEKGLVYVNLEDQSAIAVLDAKKHALIGTHPLSPGKDPTGLAFDRKHGLLFAGCGNKMLVAVDVSTWKVVGSGEIGEKCDGVVFDPETGNAYASCRDKTGGLHVKDSKTIEPLKFLDTPGGKTCALDPSTHTIYVVSGPPRGEKGVVKVLVFAPK